MAVRLLAALLAVLAAVAAPAAAAAPDDLSPDPLDRATLLALPSIYRIDVTLRVEALRTAGGETVALPPGARTLQEAGTAFAVSSDGWLATAAHVAAPDPAAVARLAYQHKLAVEGLAHDDEAVAEWVREAGARPVGYERASVRVRQASAGEGGRTPRTFTAGAVVASPAADLALVRIDAPGSPPALGLDEAATSGTPVATLGFGRGSSLSGHGDEGLGELDPALRRGVLSRSGRLLDVVPERQAIAISVPVRRGDSGAPVIDASGRVRGVVILRASGGGIAESSTELRRLMGSRGVRASEGPAAERFREAMGAFWRLDYAAATRGLEATSAAFPAHTLAPRQAARAVALAGGGFRLEGSRRLQGTLVGVAAVATTLALACALALAAPALGRRGSGGDGR